MKDYVTLENEYYEIMIPSILQEYGKEVLEYSSQKFQEYLHFFKEETYGEKIKCAIFLKREDFIKRVKEKGNYPIVPSWAQWSKGSYCGEEVQILLEEQEDIYERIPTLAHETFHLFFQKFVYEKNGWNRIVWLDEALAGNFDGTTEKRIKRNQFSKIIENLILKKDLPTMCDLDFKKDNVKTEKYNGYDLFKVVGRYLIETKTEDELFLYIHNKEQILKDGETILEESLRYFSEKYHITNNKQAEDK